jgi:hypothetical protein
MLALGDKPPGSHASSTACVGLIRRRNGLPITPALARGPGLIQAKYSLANRVFPE